LAVSALARFKGRSSEAPRVMENKTL